MYQAPHALMVLDWKFAMAIFLLAIPFPDLEVLVAVNWKQKFSCVLGLHELSDFFFQL